MTNFKQAKQLYPDLMRHCEELNFNTTYDWASNSLKKGRERVSVHYVKNWLHSVHKVYVTRGQFAAILLMLGFEVEDKMFYMDKDIYNTSSWWDELRSIERDGMNYKRLIPYVKRRCNTVAYQNYIKWKPTQEEFAQTFVYKMYKETYSVYFQNRS